MKKRIYDLNEGAQVDEKSYIIVDKEGLTSAQKIQMSTFLKNVKEKLNTNYISLWQPNTEYKVGDIVQYVGRDMDLADSDVYIKFFKCITNHTSNDVGSYPYDSDNWEYIYSFVAKFSECTESILVRDISTDNGITEVTMTGNDIYNVLRFIGDIPEDTDLSLIEAIDLIPGLKVEETLGEIFNDYENNLALGENSHTEGYMTQSSHKGYKILLVDTYQGGVVKITVKDSTLDEKAITYYAKGDRILFEGDDHVVDRLIIDSISVNSDGNSVITATIDNVEQAYRHDETTIGNLQLSTPDEKNENWICVAKKNYGQNISQYHSNHSEGESSYAIGRSSHAEGRGTIAKGNHSHTEGRETEAGYASHAEGYGSKALGKFSHAENHNCEANGRSSHAEGAGSIANGLASHVEGEGCKTLGRGTHAEGLKTITYTDYQHVEGKYNVKDEKSIYAHIVGNGNSETDRSNAYTLDWEGNAWFSGNVYIKGNDQYDTNNNEKLSSVGEKTATGEIFNDYKNNLAQNGLTYSDSVIEYISYNVIDERNLLDLNIGELDYKSIWGFRIANTNSRKYIDIVKIKEVYSYKSTGESSFNIETPITELNLGTPNEIEITAILIDNTNNGKNQHSEGNGTCAIGDISHAEGAHTLANGQYSHTEGWGTVANGRCAHSEGYNAKVTANYGHAEGCHSEAGYGAHAEGNETKANGNNSHAEGSLTTSSGPMSHAEGCETQATSYYSHAEGFKTQSKSQASHAEGNETQALAAGSHAEGYLTIAEGQNSHVEGGLSQANGYCSHAEGEGCQANGDFSHAEGRGTISGGKWQHVEGKFNIIDSEKAHIVGGGDDLHRQNIYTLDWDGNGWYSGNVETSAIILRSSTSGSTKKFKITVDDTGTLKTEEIKDNV